MKEGDRRGWDERERERENEREGGRMEKERGKDQYI